LDTRRGRLFDLVFPNSHLINEACGQELPQDFELILIGSISLCNGVLREMTCLEAIRRAKILNESCIRVWKIGFDNVANLASKLVYLLQCLQKKISTNQ
jgi:hypothetical protein